MKYGEGIKTNINVFYHIQPKEYRQELQKTDKKPVFEENTRSLFRLPF